MKTFEQFASEKQRVDEFFDPLTIGGLSLLGTMFLRSHLWDKAIDKLEGAVNHLEKDHFFKKCVVKLKTLPPEPSLEDVKHTLGPDFDRFKKEFTNQVAKP